ncbi:cytoskeleton-associated protein 2-like isoform 2-T2 [Podargus strigoides]
MDCLIAYRSFFKDRTNHLNPTLEPVSKLEHVSRNKKDVLSSVAQGAQRDGKLAAKSTQHAGHAAPQKSLSTSQRVAVVHPEQPRKSTKLPLGLVPSMNHPTKPRGRLLTSISDHLNPERNKKPAQETVTAAAPQSGSDSGAPGSLSEGLQDRLVCNKENIRPPAAAQPVPNRVFQSDGNSLGNKTVLAHRQSSATVSRTAKGPKDRINNHWAKEEMIQNKFRKTLPGSTSASQKPSVKAQPLHPPQSLTASTNLLPKKTGANWERTNMARDPLGKSRGVPPVGGLKQHSRPPQLKKSPTKSLASSRPQGTTNLKSSLKSGVTMQWQRPTAKGEVERKERKVVPPSCTATSQVTIPPKQPRSTYSSKTQATESNFRSRRERLKPELQQTSGVRAGRVPKTPSAADRKKQLEEWLASKGKTYKRPPMMLLQKKSVQLSCRNVKEKEKQEKPEQLCLKIDNLLTECLKLVEEGVQTEELLAVLSNVPQAEKFAKFWICKAKLLARSGPFDVTGLYKAAVCAGAMPLQELREVVLDILKAADQTSEAEQPVPWEPSTPERPHVAATPGPTGRSLTRLPLSIKLQVTSASRGKELLEGQELKFLTPVRRSLRIERAGSHYPEMLKDHDPVVSSLSEILDAEEETQFFFRRNKALPEVVELEGLSLYSPECC